MHSDNWKQNSDNNGISESLKKKRVVNVRILNFTTSCIYICYIWFYRYKEIYIYRVYVINSVLQNGTIVIIFLSVGEARRFCSVRMMRWTLADWEESRSESNPHVPFDSRIATLTALLYTTNGYSLFHPHVKKNE